MPASSTALVGLTSFALREAERLGADPAKVLKRAHLARSDLRDPDERIQGRKVSRFWRAIFDILPDPDLGIRLARRLD